MNGSVLQRTHSLKTAKDTTPRMAAFLGVDHDRGLSLCSVGWRSSRLCVSVASGVTVIVAVGCESCAGKKAMSQEI